MPGLARVTIDGQTHSVDHAALEMARRAYAMRASDRRMGFARIARVLQSEGFDCGGRNTARRAACLGAWANGCQTTGDVLAVLRVGVDASLELVHRGDAGDRVVRRRTTTAARAAGAAVPRAMRPRGMATRVSAPVRAAARGLANRVGLARTVGIEIEYHGRQDMVGGAAVDATRGNPAVLLAAASVGDSSVRGGAEVRGPAVRNDADGMAVYDSMLAAMRSAGATVCGANGGGICGGRCTAGIHVHIGADDLTCAQVRDVVTFYRKYGDAIDSIVSRSRRRGSGHNYSQGTSMETILGMIPDSDANARSTISISDTYRYTPVNVAHNALRRKGTVEFRQHGASLNARKVTTWARLCAAMVDHAARGDLPTYLPATATIGDVARALGMSERDAHYLAGRAT